MALTAAAKSLSDMGSANPSACACLATESATWHESFRISTSGASRLAAGSRLAGDDFGDRPRGGEEHAVRNAASIGYNRAEPDTGINVGVIGLVDAEAFAVALKRRKRAAGADHGAAFGPDIKIVRRRLGALGRIRQREDDRPAHVLSHRAYGRLRKSAGLPGRADQHRWMRVGDDVGKPDPVGASSVPCGDLIATLRERRLERIAGRSCLRPAGLGGRPDRKRPRASTSLRPASTMARSTRAQMPVPAEPAPSTATRCSCSGTPVTLIALNKVPTAIAAVPWMSSLNVHNWSR